MKRAILSVGFFLIWMSLQSSSLASEWVRWPGDDLNFEMSLRTDMKIVDKDFGEGWYGLSAISESPATIFVFNKQDEYVDEEALIQYVCDFTMILRKDVKLFDDSIPEQAGWKWRKVYETEKIDQTILFVTGHGSSGSYIFLFLTEPKDFKENYRSYFEWVESIHLLG